jgi:hypothetical protein
MLLRCALLSACAILACIVESTEAAVPSVKRGLGAGAGGPRPQFFNYTKYQLLNVSWYYDWAVEPTPLVSGVPFTPMFWSAFCLINPSSHKCGSPPPGSTHLLGFNEPDLDIQSNMTVADAVAAWPLMVAESKRLGGALIGSPATAGDPVKTWLPDFMAQVGHTVNFTTLHWYKSCHSTQFIDDVRALIQKYNKPVWITEFNTQWGDKPYAYTQAETIAFLRDVFTFLDLEPMVHRYALFDVMVGPGAIFFPENGSLTETGQFYASFVAEPTRANGDSTAKIVLAVLGGLFTVLVIGFILYDLRRRRLAAVGGSSYRPIND